jgi:hypothetical protein
VVRWKLLPNKETADPYLSLPAVDDPASVEVGVILMGLDAERLLTGLGMATLADDPASVEAGVILMGLDAGTTAFTEDPTLITLMVDRLRHEVPPGLPIDAVIATGTRRWHSARIALRAVEHAGTSPSAAVRQAWANAARTVAAADLGEPGPACRAYLTACWLRRSEVDRCMEERRALPEVTA